jgi:3-deoxy-7-phosphoheptulonate synthase
LRNSTHWDLGYVRDAESRAEYQKIVDKIIDCLNFIEMAGLTQHSVLDTVDFFTSHEALILLQEAALTKEYDGKFYNTGAHFLWIGNRTRELVNGHVEYVRGIENPVGVKVGPGMSGPELVELIKIIDPSNTPGRIVLISRFGCDKVSEELPAIVEAIQKAGLKVIWICDPMHGNTKNSSSGLKTREFNDILKEIAVTFKVHHDAGSRLNGVHFELTGENVTECTGGPQDLSENDLQIRYTTYCDPRLNYAQSMEMSFLLCKLLQEYGYHKQ